MNIFQQHLCKLGQLRRSNGRNSQVLGQAMKKRPTGNYKKYSHFKGRDTAPTTSSRVGSCIVDSSTSGERTHTGYSWPAGRGTRRTRTILSHDRTEEFVQLWLELGSEVAPEKTGLAVARERGQGSGPGS